MAQNNAINNRSSTLLVDNLLTVTASGIALGDPGSSGTALIKIIGFTNPYLSTGGATVGSSIIFLGFAGNLSSGPGGANNTIGIGNGALASLASGSQNLVIGNNSFNQLAGSPSNKNVALGDQVAANLVDGIRNVLVGVDIFSNAFSGCNDNTLIGYAAGIQADGCTNNIIIGSNAGSNYTADSSNICIGSAGIIGVSNSIVIGTNGSGAGQQNTCFIAGISGVSVSNTQMVTIDTSTGQMGSQAIPSGSGITTINGDTSSVTGATVTLTGGTTGALFSGNGTTTMTLNLQSSGIFFPDATGVETTGVLNIVGQGSWLSSGGGPAENNVIFLGIGAGNFVAATAGGAANIIGMGATALGSLTAGSDILAIGVGALGGLLGVDNNRIIAIGQLAAVSMTDGADSVIIGDGAMLGATTACSDNVIIGSQAQLNGSSFSNNIVIGSLAGSNYSSTESSVICIGSLGTTGQSNIIQIGTQGSGSGQHDKCFIAGINGVTVANTEMVTIDSSTGQMGTATIPSVSASFFANKPTNQTVLATANDQITFTSIVYNNGTVYASNAFTAPESGIYSISANLAVVPANIGDLVLVYINGTPIAQFKMQTAGIVNTIPVNLNIGLTATNVVTLQYFNNDVALSATVQGNATWTSWFQGFKIP